MDPFGPCPTRPCLLRGGSHGAAGGAHTPLALGQCRKCGFQDKIECLESPRGNERGEEASEQTRRRGAAARPTQPAKLPPRRASPGSPASRLPRAAAPTSRTPSSRVDSWPATRRSHLCSLWEQDCETARQVTAGARASDRNRPSRSRRQSASSLLSATGPCLPLRDPVTVRVTPRPRVPQKQTACGAVVGKFLPLPPTTEPPT